MSGDRGSKAVTFNVVYGASQILLASKEQIEDSNLSHGLRYSAIRGARGDQHQCTPSAYSVPD